MKKLVAIGLCFFVMFSVPVVAANTTKRDQVQTLLSVMHFDQTQVLLAKRFTNIVVTYVVKNNPHLLPLARAAVKRTVRQQVGGFLKNINIRQTVKDLYVQQFTTAELAAMIRFYKTPEGQSILQKLPVVMQQATQLYYDQVKADLPSITSRINNTLRNQGYSGLNMSGKVD